MLFQIVIHADTICTWCYLGKRSLDRAVETYTQTHPDARFDITWKSYILYPKLAHGTPKRVAYEKFTTSRKDPPEASLNRIHDLGIPLGIDIDFSGTTGPSQDSHRLLALARRRCGPAAQVRLADALLHAHLEQGRDISDLPTLARLAVEWDSAGGGGGGGGGGGNGSDGDCPGLSLAMTAEQVEAWLRGNGGRAEIGQAVREMADIEAVPTITVQGRYLVGGYQEPAFFVRLFERLEYGETQKSMDVETK